MPNNFYLSIDEIVKLAEKVDCDEFLITIDRDDYIKLLKANNFSLREIAEKLSEQNSRNRAFITKE